MEDTCRMSDMHPHRRIVEPWIYPKSKDVLDDNTYGPDNRPHWVLNKTRFPNLIRALNLEPDMDTRKRISSLYHVIT